MIWSFYYLGFIRYSQLKVKLVYKFKRATGINFPCVLLSQRPRKIHPSSTIFFLKCINYTLVSLNPINKLKIANDCATIQPLFKPYLSNKLAIV